MVRISDRVVVQIEWAIVYVLSLYYAWRFIVCPWRATRMSARRFCRTAWRTVRPGLCWCRPRRTNVLHNFIQAQLKERRAVYCQGLSTFLAHLLGPSLLVMAIRGHLSGDFDQADYHHAVRLGWYLCIYMVTLVLASGRLKLRALMFDIVLLIMVCTVNVRIARMVDDPAFFLDDGARLFARLATGVLCLDYTRSVPYNVSISLIICWRYPHNSTAIRIGSGSNFLTFTMKEIMLCSGMNIAFYYVQTWVEARIRAQIIAQNQERACFTLAARHCKTIVCLTEDLCLSHPAPQFAKMLLLQDSRGHLSGKPFEQYIASDNDRNRFKQYVAQSIASSNPEDLPPVFHMELRDMSNQIFPVDVFHCCFVRKDERIGHLIGLMPARVSWQHHKSEDEKDTQSTRPRHSTISSATSICPDVHKTSALDVKSVAISSALFHSARSTEHKGNAQGLLPLISEEKAPAPFGVLFDVEEQEFVGCTMRFRALAGQLLSKAGARHWFVNYDDFLWWMQHWVFVFHHGGGQDCTPLRARIARPPSGRQDNIEFHVDAYLREFRAGVRASEVGLELEAGIEDREYRTICFVEFNDIHVQRLGSKQFPKSSVVNDWLSAPAITL